MKTKSQQFRKFTFITAWLLLSFAFSNTAKPSNTPKKEKDYPNLGKTEAYLFAHMTANDYGRLYYAVSTDGLNWNDLNDGKRVDSTYRGHPDICKGPDGTYYLMGNTEKGPDIRIWSSKDLLKWDVIAQFYPDMTVLPEFVSLGSWFGAPKMFYDAKKGEYVITFHVSLNKSDKNDFEKQWRGMRTLFVTTSDFKNFSKPKRLFQFDMATIDVIIRKESDTYYAILKDESYPTFEWPTGKSIRVCWSKNATGPWSKPTGSISPNFREAPTLLPKPDGNGYYLYFEQYPGIQYGMATAPSLKGPWFQSYIMTYSVPKEARHGCMIPISMEEYNRIIAKFGK